MFMAFRFMVASSGDWPPERKQMPGTADGTVFRKHRTVLSAISATVAGVVESAPGRTMLGFRITPSSKDTVLFQLLKGLSKNLRRNPLAHVNIVVTVHENLWLDDGNDSPSWQRAAYRARACALAPTQ